MNAHEEMEWAANLAEKLRTGLQGIPLEHRLGIPCSIFITTALEEGMSVSDVVAFVKDSAQEYAREMRADGLKVSDDPS